METEWHALTLPDALPSCKGQLAGILGRAGDDYQRCLWYTVAGRDPLAVATSFGELAKLMAARAMLWVEADDRGLTPAKADNPYWTTRPEGPPATFSDRFELGRSDEHTSELQSLMRTSYAVFCLNKTTTLP